MVGAAAGEQSFFWLLTEQRAATYVLKQQRQDEQQGPVGVEPPSTTAVQEQVELDHGQKAPVELPAAAVLQALACSAADVPAFLERRGLGLHASGCALQAACNEALLAILQHGGHAAAPPCPASAAPLKGAAATAAPGSADAPLERFAAGEGNGSEEEAAERLGGAAGPGPGPGVEAAAAGEGSEQEAGAFAAEDCSPLDLEQQAAEAVAVHGMAAATARLLKLGAQAGHVRASDGATPLVAALLGGHMEAAGQLLDAGAPPDPPAWAAASPGGQGDAAADDESGGSRACKRKRNGAEPDDCGAGSVAAVRGSPTPLVLAAAAASAELVERLLAAGAEAGRGCVVRVAGSGRGVALTPLIAAVNAGSQPCVARLLAAGADLHHKCAVAPGGGASADWTSALSAAVLSGSAGMVRVLVGAGACAGRRGGAAVGRDHPALRAVALAAARGRCDMLDAMYPPLASGLAGGSAAMVGTLKRRTALHPLAAAAERGQLAAVERLLELGAPAGHGDSVVAGVAQHTPLMLAAANGHLDVVRLLLDAGACPLRLNAHSRAAAALALAAGQLAALRLLLEHTGELAALTAWAQGQQQQQQQQQQQGTSAVVAAGAESQAAGALGRQPGGAATGPAASGATQLLPQVSNASKAWQTGFTAGALPRQRPLTLSALERERQRYQLLLGALLAAQAEGGGPAAAAAAAVRAAATPAALAHAAAGSEALLDALLRCGASLACVDPADGSFPLLAACHLGWPAMLRLLRRGADPNQADASGGTALALLASRPGMADALAALLRWDAALPPGHPRLDLWRRDAAGRDAVGAALAARNRAAAELLLDELAARQEAAAAASQASQQRQHQQQQAGGAEGAGAEAGAVPPRAAGAPPSPAASRAYELLLAQGARCVADINRPPEGGQHPLLAAAAASTRKQLRQVLQLPGMDAGVRDGAGRTALLLAAARQQPALVAELVGSGRVDVAARDAAGCTAVLLAARAGCAAVLRVLVEAGADASAADHEGSTPLMALAAGGQHKLLAELLRSAHPPPLDAADRRGWTALHHAAAAGSFNACKVLRGWGADASLRAGEGGPTAAELASRGGHASCLPLLQPPAEPPVTQ